MQLDCKQITCSHEFLLKPEENRIINEKRET